MSLLERVLLYLSVLERLRKDSSHISEDKFIVLVGKVPPETVQQDLAQIGITLDANSNIDLQKTYWSVIEYRQKAEEEATIASNLQLHLPSKMSIRDTLPRRPGTNSSGRDANCVAGARILDLAFDCLEKLDLMLLGHGRMADGQVAFRHQLETAKLVLEGMNGVAIIADEVGLGKTNVAGLILEEVLTEEPNAAVLILVPPNLRKQWIKDELPTYFRRNVWSDATELSALAKASVVLLSLDQAKGTGKGDALSAVLLARKWDLLIVDEAHDCRNANRLRFRFVYSLQAKRRVFLTATPIHNSGYDIFNLATLLKPGCLGTKRFFAEKHMNGERLLKESKALRQTIDSIMTRKRRKQTGLAFAPRDLTVVEIKSFKLEETKLYDELLTILQGIYRRHVSTAGQIASPSGGVRYVSQFVLIAMLVLREMASHPSSAIHTLKTALRARVLDFARLTRDDSDLNRIDEFIYRYAKQSWRPAHHAKTERLLKESRKLFAAGKKFVIYVNYLKTLQIVAKLLAKQHPDASIVSYEGSLDPDKKEDAIDRFKTGVKACLVSTDSGGQGLNLQFADCVVNYDFPWNPMRIEQRIGRVDRVKQTSPQIKVLNFRTRGTVEEYVQIVLTFKLKECRNVLGEFSSPLQIEKVYEDKLTMGIGKALMEARNAADMRKRMENLGVDELKRYVGDYSIYEKAAPPEWTWQPRD